MLCYFFWVIPLRLNFKCRRFGTLCLFHLHRWCKQEDSVVCFLLGNSQRLKFICRRFGTLRPFHLHRQVCVCTHIYLPMKMERTECSETSAYKLQTRGITQKKAYNIQDTAKVRNQEDSAYTTYADGTDRVFRNVRS